MNTRPLPAVGTKINIRVDGTEIEGKVIGISVKDGKSIVEYLGPCLLSNGELSEPTTRWCWLEQIPHPTFENWFRGSQVVDDDNLPMVVYQGTKSDFSVFEQSDGSSSGSFERGGIYFSDSPKTASLYANTPGEGGPLVMPVYLAIKNPWHVVGSLHDIEEAKRLGYDGIFCGQYGDMTIVAFYPHQIKSAIGNCGTFDPENPDITK